ncbi:Phage Mu protein F like protein [Loigolactobacillus bifermentans DSM 20003]|uniref:Phage Mu protein F like protein n=1 Tax=Loigolactobacillus bifermentans DSM 20003 TaxID=1423726 RepID=A0A0R1H494_9LACO|nr:Phage Mu protein F like protein [Loigolactobacillus bifermentans DSM 20003]
MDDKSSKQSDQYYDEALAYISNHLTEFFAHYAVANNLTLTQVNQRVSKWDLAQWQVCIDELETDDWLPEAKKKAKAIGIIAGISVQSMMTAIVGMAVINMVNKRINLISDRATIDRKDEMDRMGKLIGNKGIDAKKADKAIIKAASKEKAKEPDNQPKNSSNSSNKPQQTGDGNSDEEKPKPAKKTSEEPKEVDRPTVSNRLWIDGDQMMNDLENMLLDMLKGNMSLEDLRDSLREHVNPDQFDPSKSMADRLRQQNYIIDRLIRSESARMKDRTNDYYYKKNGIKYVNFVCEPNACKKCLSISAGGPYLLDEAPKITDDTHPNCRCGKVPAMDINDYLSVDINSGKVSDLVSNSPVENVKGLTKHDIDSYIEMLNKPLSEANKYPFNDNYRQNMIDFAKKHGYDRSPAKMTRDEFDRIPNEAKIYRGTNRDEQLINGELEYSIQGSSLNGRGIYFSDSLSDVQNKYLDGDNRLVNAALRSDTVLVDKTDFQKAVMDRVHDFYPELFMNPANGTLLFDAVAIGSGVDGWYNSKGNKVVIVNRGKLVIAR